MTGKRRSLHVYLAGTMDADWRSDVARRLMEAGAEVWHPQDNVQRSPAFYVPADLKMAAECDALFAYVMKGHKARGTHAEMGVAFQAGRPIWLVWRDGPQVYSFSAVMAYKVFTDMDAAVEDLIVYIKKGDPLLAE